MSWPTSQITPSAATANGQTTRLPISIRNGRSKRSISCLRTGTIDAEPSGRFTSCKSASVPTIT